MISYKELLGNHTIAEIPIQHQHNLEELLKRINVIREAWGKSMIITSGYRSMQEHLRIYSEKGITDKSKIPMQSRHLYGMAVDIADTNQELQHWLKDNVKILEDNGLWMEDFSATKTWCHFQIVPPKSNNRWFLP